MKLVWHIVKKDLRRMALPLALWSVLLIAPGEIGVRLLNGDGADLVLFDTLRLAANMVLGLDAFVQLVLVVLLVQEDGLVGTAMFWATRPISGTRLLAAKLLGASLMFGVLPILISLRWWLACGDGPMEIAHAALVTLDQRFFITLGGMLLASLTGSVNQFFGWLVGGIVAVMAWLFFLAQLQLGNSDWEPRLLSDYLNGARVMETQRLVVGAVVLAAVSVIVVSQFRTRRRGRSVGLAVVAGMTASLVFVLWPWDWSRLWSTTAKNSPTAAAVTATVDRAVAGPEMSWVPNWRELDLSYVFHGIPENLGLSVTSVNRFSWPDGTTAARPGHHGTLKPRLGEWKAVGLPREKFRGAAHVTMDYADWGDPFFGSERFEGVSYAKIAFRPPEVERMLLEAPSWVGELRLEFIQPVDQLEVPIRAGAVGTGSGRRVRVASTSQREDQVFVTGIESWPATPNDQTVLPGFAWWLRSSAAANDGIHYWLVNRSRAEKKSFSPNAGVVAVIGGKAIRWWRDTLTAEDWLEGATLHSMRYSKTETFHLTVTAENLRVTSMKTSP